MADAALEPELDAIVDRWRDVGVLYGSDEPALHPAEPVDLERMLLDTVRLMVHMPRLFNTTATWLHAFGDLIAKHRLRRLVGHSLDPSLQPALGALLDTAQGAFADAREWLGDEQLRADARSAVWKAGTLIDAATAAMNSVSESAQGIRVDARTLVTSAQPALDEMARTLQAVQRLADQAGSGEGTVGQLMSNPDLYNALTDSALRLKAALAEVELLLKKVRDEGLDVKF